MKEAAASFFYVGIIEMSTNVVINFKQKKAHINLCGPT
jgi:hypothetical protein